MRKAVIDMGTNTFNLLIADVSDCSFKMIYSTKEPVLLGMGGINDNLIAKDALSRAFLAIKKFAGKCDAFKVDRDNILAIGTSALRGASNSAEYLESVKQLFNINVSIVSGDEEANFIFQGVKWSHDFSNSAVIMDIGGGSSEFIHANASGILNLVSLDIGVSRVYQLFDHPKQYTKDLQSSILSYFDDCASNVMRDFTTETLIGASGSFETFYEMIFQSELNPNQKVIELPLRELVIQLEWAVNSNQIERDKHVWITQIRKTMLPIAALQIIWALKKTNAQRVLMSPYSLKEGALR
jgi:exopolyphosphatase/guanosine-5'-triphosphate,3'-diphosphate pyrophosphatase